MKKTIATIKRSKDLRELWPNEQYDFTKWLATETGLNELGNELGLNLELEERESYVGDFRVDIYAKATGVETEEGEKKVIIENQLETTDHNHLGKIITYAAGKNADIVIWIVKDVREEHRNAIKWLNEHLYNDKKQKDIAFFLVELDSIRIGDSALAPEFKVVEKPNNWLRTVQKINTMTKNDKNKLNFWEQFFEYYREKKVFTNEFSADSPSTRHYCDLRFGEQFHFYLYANFSKKKDFGISVYTRNKDVYTNFEKHKKIIEKHIGSKLKWQSDKKSYKIKYTGPFKWIENEKDWPKIFDWYVSVAPKYKEVFLKYSKK